MSSRLLLTGIVLAAGWSALVTLLLTIAPERELRGILFWLMGDLGGATTYVPALVALVAAVIVLLPQGRALNVMLRGPVVAQSLGVPVTRVRRMLFVIASVATALAVTTAGTIGFVGLIVPHALRLAIGNDQRVLLPASALAGGTLLVLADTLARTVIAPAAASGRRDHGGARRAGVHRVVAAPGRTVRDSDAALLEVDALRVGVGGRTLIDAVSFAVRPATSGACWAPTAPARRCCCTRWPGCDRRTAGAIALAARPVAHWRLADAARVRGFLPQFAR